MSGPASMSDVIAEAVDVTRVFGTNGSKVVAVKHATCAIQRGDRIRARRSVRQRQVDSLPHPRRPR